MATGTNNPVGSNAPEDLSANATNFDNLLNGPNSHYPDRFGVQRKSYSMLENNMHAALAGATGPVYDTSASGIAKTSNGDYFWVAPNDTDGVSFPTLYKNDSGSATKIIEQVNLSAYLVKEGQPFGDD